MSEPSWPDMWLDLEPWPQFKPIKMYPNPQAYYPNGYLFYAPKMNGYSRGARFRDDRQNLYEVRWVVEGKQTDIVYCQLLAIRS